MKKWWSRSNKIELLTPEQMELLTKESEKAIRKDMREKWGLEKTIKNEDCDCELVEGCRKCLGLDTKWKGEGDLGPIYDAIFKFRRKLTEKIIKEFISKEFNIEKDQYKIVWKDLHMKDENNE